MKEIEIVKNKKILIKYLDKKIELSNEEQKLIDEYWETLPKFFTRGNVFCVTNIENQKEEINITVGNTDYAHYIYVRRHPQKIKNCFNLWAGILLETLDGKYIFGKMSDITASVGEYHISGGTCDKKEIENGYINYEKSMYRELKEEMGLCENDLNDVRVKFLKLPSETEEDFGILYKAIVNKTSLEMDCYFKEFLKKLETEGGEIEFTELKYIDKRIESIDEFAQNNIINKYAIEMMKKDI